MVSIGFIHTGRNYLYSLLHVPISAPTPSLPILCTAATRVCSQDSYLNLPFSSILSFVAVAVHILQVLSFVESASGAAKVRFIPTSSAGERTLPCDADTNLYLRIIRSLAGSCTDSSSDLHHLQSSHRRYGSSFGACRQLPNTDHAQVAVQQIQPSRDRSTSISLGARPTLSHPRVARRTIRTVLHLQ